MDVVKDLIAAGVLIFSLLFLLWMLRVAWSGVKHVEARWLRLLRWAHKPDARIARVYLYQNGMVRVFNHSDQQLSELQGPYSEIRERLIARLPEQVVFRWGEWVSGQLCIISRRQFEQWQPGWRPRLELRG